MWQAVKRAGEGCKAELTWQQLAGLLRLELLESWEPEHTPMLLTALHVR